MSRIFRTDSPVMRELYRFSSMVILSVLWLVCCIPIITIGASTTALYYATGKEIQGEGKAVENFFHSFRMNLKPAMIAELIFWAVGIFLVLDVLVLTGVEMNGKELVYALLTILLIFSMALWSYVFPILSHFHCSIGELFRNACMLSVLNLPSTILVILVNAVPFLLAMWSLGWFFRLVPILLFVWPGAAARINSHRFDRIFRKSCR